MPKKHILLLLERVLQIKINNPSSQVSGKGRHVVVVVVSLTRADKTGT